MESNFASNMKNWEMGLSLVNQMIKVILLMDLSELYKICIIRNKE